MQRILSVLVAVIVTGLLFAAALLGIDWFMNHAPLWAALRSPWFGYTVLVFNSTFTPMIAIWIALQAKSSRSEPDAPIRLPRIGD